MLTDVTTALLVLYVAGVIVGLVAVDARGSMRIVLPLLWPLGPAAFVIVIAGLTLVAIVLWPLRLLPILAAIGALAYWLA
ncbi:MAG: hypothetical protein LC791_07755 [Acidobacteria bacterium]|nr:hypothetical protein [Acidobacteriota bacterium]